MSIGTYLFLSIISTITIIVTICRIISWEQLVQFHWASDVGFTLIGVYLLSGSRDGMIIAIISGFLFSMIMTIARRLHKPLPKQEIQDGISEG